MEFVLPKDVVSILTSLKQAGYQSYIVGGAVRDLLQKKEVGDWDFATDATPEAVQKLFPGSFYDNQFGTVGIPVKDQISKIKDRKEEAKNAQEKEREAVREVYEVTTYRTESAYTDRRRPDHVEWGKTIEEDLSRRDFTINAMAMKPESRQRINGSKGKKSEDGVRMEVKLIDPFSGQKDLGDRIIRAVRNPEERFNEDALRMMRAIRIGAELGFRIEEHTLAAIKRLHALLPLVSWERIRDEFLKMIASPYPADGVMMLYQTGLLGHIVPELLGGVGLPQGGHHIYDVFTHNIESLRHCPSSDVLVRLATLLHDVGKPKAHQIRDGKPTFYSHEVIGARMIKDIANRLKLSSDQRNFLWKLVRWHMFAYDPSMTDAAVRRFVRRVGREDIVHMMALRVGDRKGGGSRETSWRLEELKRRIEQVLYDPLNVTDLVIDGHDVMSELHIRPGPQVGKILNALFEEVLEDPGKNNRGYLLSRISAVA